MINKKTLKSKKGFTIVELVIVIAVIAILAAVLIPTFVGVSAKAKEAAALSDAKNAYEQLTIDITWNSVYGDGDDNYNAALENYDEEDIKTAVIVSGGYYFAVTNGVIGEAKEGTYTSSQSTTPVTYNTVSIYIGDSVSD